MIMNSSPLEQLEIYMVVNFKVREISRGARKLVRTFILIIIIIIIIKR
jgi:hypothetical protein